MSAGAVSLKIRQIDIFVSLLKQSDMSEVFFFANPKNYFLSVVLR